MIRECSNCNTKISLSEFYKQYFSKDRFKYTCSICGTVHKATTFSIIISIIAYSVIFTILFLHFIPKSKLTFIVNFSLVIIMYFLLLQPLILQYKKKFKWLIFFEYYVIIVYFHLRGYCISSYLLWRNNERRFNQLLNNK